MDFSDCAKFDPSDYLPRRSGRGSSQVASKAIKTLTKERKIEPDKLTTSPMSTVKTGKSPSLKTSLKLNMKPTKKPAKKNNVLKSHQDCFVRLEKLDQNCVTVVNMKENTKDSVSKSQFDGFEEKVGNDSVMAPSPDNNAVLKCKSNSFEKLDNVDVKKKTLPEKGPLSKFQSDCFVKLFKVKDGSLKIKRRPEKGAILKGRSDCFVKLGPCIEEPRQTNVCNQFIKDNIQALLAKRSREKEDPPAVIDTGKGNKTGFTDTQVVNTQHNHDHLANVKDCPHTELHDKSTKPDRKRTLTNEGTITAKQSDTVLHTVKSLSDGHSVIDKTLQDSGAIVAFAPSGKYELKCGFCPKTFFHAKDLIYHKGLVHSITRPMCDKCADLLTDNHLALCAARQRCNVCGILCRQLRHLVQHQQKMHSKEGAMQHTCFSCFFQGSTHEDLQRHQCQGKQLKKSVIKTSVPSISVSKNVSSSSPSAKSVAGISSDKDVASSNSESSSCSSGLKYLCEVCLNMYPSSQALEDHKCEEPVLNDMSSLPTCVSVESLADSLNMHEMRGTSERSKTNSFSVNAMSDLPMSAVGSTFKQGSNMYKLPEGNQAKGFMSAMLNQSVNQITSVIPIQPMAALNTSMGTVPIKYVHALNQPVGNLNITGILNQPFGAFSNHHLGILPNQPVCTLPNQNVGIVYKLPVGAKPQLPFNQLSSLPNKTGNAVLRMTSSSQASTPSFSTPVVPPPSLNMSAVPPPSSNPSVNFQGVSTPSMNFQGVSTTSVNFQGVSTPLVNFQDVSTPLVNFQGVSNPVMPTLPPSSLNMARTEPLAQVEQLAHYYSSLVFQK